MLKQYRMQRLPEDRQKYLTINQVNNLFVYHTTQVNKNMQIINTKFGRLKSWKGFNLDGSKSKDSCPFS